MGHRMSWAALVSAVFLASTGCATTIQVGPTGSESPSPSAASAVLAGASPSPSPSLSPSASDTPPPPTLPPFSQPPISSPVGVQQTTIPTTPANDLPACSLPASGIIAGSAGFIAIPGGTFTRDPTSNIPIPGQQDSSGLKRGYTWDPIDKRWLPVPREWVQPDFSSYIYTGPQNQQGIPDIHEVTVATGVDKVYPGGQQVSGMPLAIRPEGLYGAGGPLIFDFVDRGGVLKVLDQNRDGLSYLVSPGAYWATNSGQPYSLTDAMRVDAVTGAAQVWFHRPQTSWTVGFDSHGNPIVAVGSRNGISAQPTVSELWIVPSPSTGQDPIATSIFFNPGQPLQLQGAPIDSNGWIWISTTSGIYAWDESRLIRGFKLASTYNGWIAGACR